MMSIPRSQTSRFWCCFHEATAAIFGLHGLPLRRHPREQVQSAQGQPAKVLPADLVRAYNITGVTPSGGTKNRQAVAEFQGQTMNATDLSLFFSRFVPDAPASDSAVYRMHGEPKKSPSDGVEAMLDIEYIMGVAPGIKTEFYEQMNQDFCSDLKNWT